MKKLFFAALFMSALCMVSCGSKERSIKDVEIKGALADYLELNGTEAKISIEEDLGESGAFTTFYNFYQTITIAVPVKIIKELPSDEEMMKTIRLYMGLDICGDVEYDNGHEVFYTAGGHQGVVSGFAPIEMENYEKLMTSPVGTEGTLVFKTVLSSSLGQENSSSAKKELRKQADELLKKMAEGKMIITSEALDKLNN